MLPRLLVTFALLCMALTQVRGHGYLYDPPSRSSLWRHGVADALPNYNDNQLNCGGFYTEFGLNQGKCGVCGDPFAEPPPRSNEAGGKYGKGIIIRHYQPGQTVNVKVEITANHKGHFEFRLCPNNDVKKVVTQECLDKHLLEMADGSGTTYDLGTRTGEITVPVKLPPGLVCSQCVLQWKWKAGNSYGRDPDGHTCIGCGNQEEFYGCADISIGTSGQMTPPPATQAPVTQKPFTPAPVYTQPPNTPKPFVPVQTQGPVRTLPPIFGPTQGPVRTLPPLFGPTGVTLRPWWIPNTGSSTQQPPLPVSTLPPRPSSTPKPFVPVQTQGPVRTPPPIFGPTQGPVRTLPPLFGPTGVTLRPWWIPLNTGTQTTKFPPWFISTHAPVPTQPPSTSAPVTVPMATSLQTPWWNLLTNAPASSQQPPLPVSTVIMGQLKCQGINTWAGVPELDSWCNVNCNQGKCPDLFCACA